MQDSFWQALPQPFFIQAPMEDVTDAAFRRHIARHGKPHVMFTEFTSADGLVLAPESGQKTLRKKLEFAPEERPIVAQLFSSIPERMERAAAMVQEMGFDGIDINMGCPDRSVEKSGCGAALIRTPDLALELIRAVRRGAPRIPVSVKTRIGYAHNELSTWIPALLSEKPAIITIHARTRNEMSDVPARWEHIREAVALRDKAGVATLIAGNGDVKDLDDARAKAAETGCDGIMLGRAIYGNPWLYAGRTQPPTRQERITALREHVILFDELLSEVKSFAVMKKHFKAYISGWDGAKEFREHLMAATTPQEAIAILESEL